MPDSEMGHSPERFASGPWHGGEGEEYHHCPRLFWGQEEP